MHEVVGISPIYVYDIYHSQALVTLISDMFVPLKENCPFLFISVYVSLSTCFIYGVLALWFLYRLLNVECALNPNILENRCDT